MSDSGEDKASEQESKSQEGETSKNSKKRTLDADEDEDTKNQSSKLVENLKNVPKKQTARKIEFERTEEEALPLACPICKEPFLDPIVTKCNHYFCHHCALKRHGKNNTCFLCDQPTLGVFNTAVEMKKKIAQVRESAKVMVKEVKTMVENAAVIVKEAEAMAAESAEMVAGVETIVGILENFGPDSVADPSWHSVINLVENVEDIAANARGKAEKAAEMVKEANATTETARAEMVKALGVMKNVKWNV